MSRSWAVLPTGNAQEAQVNTSSQPLPDNAVELSDGTVIDTTKPLGRRIFAVRVERAWRRFRAMELIYREWASYR